MIRCPICQDDMPRKAIHRVEVDLCERHGIWLDRKELLAITERERQESSTFEWGDLFRREQRPPIDRHRALDCPHCAQPMKLEPYKSVMIDWCQEHGVFLDNGELEAILNNLRLDPLFVGKVALRLWEERF